MGLNGIFCMFKCEQPTLYGTDNQNIIHITSE